MTQPIAAPASAYESVLQGFPTDEELIAVTKDVQAALKIMERLNAGKAVQTYLFHTEYALGLTLDARGIKFQYVRPDPKE